MDLLSDLDVAANLLHATNAGTLAPAFDHARMPVRIARLEQELLTLKRLKRAADVELVELRSHLHEADLKLGAGQSGYYRLGRLLIEGFTSFRGVLRLVPGLISLAYDEWRARPKAARKITRRATGVDFGPMLARDGSLISQVHLRARSTGSDAAAAWVNGLNRIAPALKARLLMEVAKLCRHSDAATAIEIARKALSFDNSEAYTRWLAFALFDAGWVSEPAQLIRDLQLEKRVVPGGQAELAERIFARESLLFTKVDTLPPAPCIKPAAGQRLLLLADHILPLRWSLTGWRNHLIAQTLQAQGCEVVIACASQPGGAQPRIGHTYNIDGVRYAVMSGPDEKPALFWLNGDNAAYPQIEFDDLKITTIITSSRLQTMMQAMRLASLHSCRFVIDDEGDEPFAAAGITSAATETVQLARQLKQDFAIAAHQLVSPWRHTPLPMLANAHNSALLDHSILHGRRVIGFAGDQAPEYNFANLPAIFQQVADTVGKHDKVALLIAGVHRSLDLVEDQLIERGFDHDVLVLHRPTSSQLAAIYAAMDVFVAPTTDNCNALDRAPIEVIFAIRFGVPVVAADCAAAQRWKAAGLPILISNRGDAGSLATELARVLSNPKVLAEARRRIAAWNAMHSAGLLDIDD